MSFVIFFGNPSSKQPEIVLKALLELKGSTDEGALVRAVALPWFEILERVKRDPEGACRIEARAWEEMIATPRSGDKGRDVVATRSGVGSIRIFDQVKAYKPGHVVTADEVRAMIGVITGAANVSKGVITRTSTFAPRVTEDDYTRPFLPYRLELKPREPLLKWLDELATVTPPAKPS